MTIHRVCSAIAILLFPIISFANTSLIEQIHRVEAEYGLPHGYLVTIAEIETNFDPLAVNVNGIPFHFNSKSSLVSGLKGIAANPYLVSVRNNGELTHFFRKTRQSAEALSDQLMSEGLNVVERGGDRWRRLETSSTDLCVLQVNYQVHAGTDFHTVEDIVDLEHCLSFGARYLSQMIERFGVKMGPGCYHYCDTDSIHYQRYTARFKRAYERRFGIDPITKVALQSQ